MRIRVKARHSSSALDAVERHQQPLTFGLPLARGAAHTAGDWTAVDTAGRRNAAQTQILDRWPDGSARWVLVDTRLDVPARRDVEFEIDTEAPGPPSSPAAIVLSRDTDGVSIDTGAAVFRVAKGARAPFDSIVVNGKHPDAGSARLVITGADNTPFVVGIAGVEVEAEGPLRASVRAHGTARASTGDTIDVVLTYDFFLALATVRVGVCLRNPKPATHPGGFWDLGDRHSILIKEVSLQITPPRQPRTAVTASIERDASFDTTVAPFEVYQESSGGDNWQSTNHVNRNRQVPMRFRGYKVRAAGSERSGRRATPIISISSETSSLTALVPEFWEAFPKSVTYDGTRLDLQLFPSQFPDVHELQPGEQKTSFCVLAFAPDPTTAEPLVWARAPIVACVDSGWILDSGAVPFLDHLAQNHADLVNAAVDGEESFAAKRERVDQYGWRHFGDIYGDHEAVRTPGLVSHYNNQYDPVAGFAYQFFRTGDLRWWHMMDELARHVIDIDVYHTTADKSAYNHGLFWHTYHYGDADTATHRTYPKSAQGKIHGGGPSADHNYTTGLMLHYFLTGNPTSKDTVVQLARYVVDIDDGRRTPLRYLSRAATGAASSSAPGYHGPGRGPANSLAALLDGHRLSGSDALLSKAEDLIRRVIHPHDDIAERCLDVPEQRWFYTMFLQSLGRYLAYKAERGELDAMYAYGRDSLLHYARWMVTFEHPYLDRPEKLEFPTETWPAQDIRKSDVFYFAATHATDVEQQTFIERARFFHHYSVDTLQSLATRTLARPVVILSTSGYMQGWFERPGRQAAMPAPLLTPQYGSPRAFLPQRVRAKRNLAVVGIAAAALALLLLTSLLFRG